MTSHFNGPLLDHGKGENNREWYEDLPLIIDPDYVVFLDDFLGEAFDSTNDWNVVKDTGASVAIEADQVGGRVLLSSAATTDNDGSSIQGQEVFALASGRDIWFETRLQVSDADQMDIFVGLTVAFSTNPEAVLTAADRIGFQVDDGDASILAKTEKDGTESSTDTEEDLSDDTDVILGFRVREDRRVEFYVDRKLVAEHDTNLPDDENLALAAFELSGDASGTKTMSLDYIFAAMTR